MVSGAVARPEANRAKARDKVKARAKARDEAGARDVVGDAAGVGVRTRAAKVDPRAGHRIRPRWPTSLKVRRTPI